MTTTAQQTALEKPVAGAAWFVELDFLNGTVRVCSYSQNYTWGGYEWLGLGSIGSISAVEESMGVSSSAMTFGLHVAQNTLLALAVGSVEQYRGRAAKLYFCPLNENGVLVDTPEICWRGVMDIMSVGIDGEEGQIALKCETSAYGLKRRSLHRLNAAQHKIKNPTDTGLDYLNDLIATPAVWLSKAFQAI